MADVAAKATAGGTMNWRTAVRPSKGRSLRTRCGLPSAAGSCWRLSVGRIPEF